MLGSAAARRYKLVRTVTPNIRARKIFVAGGLCMGSLMAIIILTALVAAFGAFLVWGSGKLGPTPKITPEKVMPYECGLPGQEMKDTKVSVKFYLTAILFILFDIEIIFMYPWALSFFDSIKAGQGMYYLGVMGVFLLLFIVGLIWEVKSRALDWK